MLELEKACRLLRYYILTMTTRAGSGHATSSLSAVELLATLFYKYFRFDLESPELINNDRLIFSKGHASPLFYSLYKIAGKLSEDELYSYRKFDSVLEGHPSKRFKYTEVPTGSLGQGLSAGLGMALSAKLDGFGFKTYVLLGDGEIAEGQVWEALETASHYHLNNLVGIIDVNRLGQTGETLLGYDLIDLEKRIKSFGWKTYLINDGNNLDEVDKAFQFVLTDSAKDNSPYMILAKTVKGKGVSFLENKNGWHGKALSEDDCQKGLKELGEVDKNLHLEVQKPPAVKPIKQSPKSKFEIQNPIYKTGDLVATRESYGQALAEIGEENENIVVLDGDVGNSTFTDIFGSKFSDRFYQMFIAEQNMVSVSLGLSQRGKTPYLATFSSFITRAADQIRMAHLSENHLIVCGSHAGVSIGEDGPSQMGLEDLAFFRAFPNATIFYPSDGVSAFKLTQLAYSQKGLVYLRTTRPKTPMIYENSEDFEIGGSKVLKKSDNDFVTVIASGVTVHETLKAYESLKKNGIETRVIDAYSIKPLDRETVITAANETKAIVTVEDHYVTGGLGDAVLEVLANEAKVPVYKMGVVKTPRSGTMAELLEYEEIDAKAILGKVVEIVG